jgi:hypothetical protein
MFGTHFTDLCYGYNAFWARHLGAIDVSNCPGFEVETLMNIRAAKAGLTIHEVPSHESPRIFGVSNLHAVRDGWRILKLIMRERLSGFRKRGPHGPAATSATVALSPIGRAPAGPYRMRSGCMPTAGRSSASPLTRPTPCGTPSSSPPPRSHG